jgi:hypothetical protein
MPHKSVVSERLGELTTGLIGLQPYEKYFETKKRCFALHLHFQFRVIPANAGMTQLNSRIPSLIGPCPALAPAPPSL